MKKTIFFLSAFAILGCKVKTPKPNPYCSKCKGKGYVFVDEWIGHLQGMKDCTCLKSTN